MSDKVDNKNSEAGKEGMNRREVLKGLATIPVLGAMAYGAIKKVRFEDNRKSNLKQVVNLSSEDPNMYSYSKSDRQIRIGLIGFGIRGEQLMRAAGFAHPEVIDNLKEASVKNSSDKRYDDYLNQDNLNIVINGVSDVFDYRSERAQLAAANEDREGISGSFLKKAKIYKNWRDLVAADDIDAVIIATPDHWHSKMAIEAARHGKHVYVEKAMTRTIEEAFELKNAIKEANIVFQLGHQGRQTESNLKAREAINKGVIGNVNLIEVCTNRNSPNGAWVYDIHPDANENTIDWQQFEEPCEVKHPFSLERFFRWRCWWDYGTGLSGDLLTHEYDAINQIMDLGIPDSAVASGGVYFYKDKKAGHYINEVREVPDVFQVSFDYKDRDLTLLYSASLASNMERGKMIMGHDGYMDLGNTLNIYADRESTKYSDKIKTGIIKPDLPIYTFIPGRNNVDAVSSPTEQYFAGRGLLYTYRSGKRVDTTHLHIKEWIEAIRESLDTGKTILPSCNINMGFQEAITAHMATIAYREQRTVFWDKENEKIV
ncbi:MAG: Gfo/Idh/MocA family oxidoreductase [Bacteroidales bacterium]|nr:Gfo/Idh/MocA family oxidoreductase [Bacteroidales bacterium]MCF8391088.1 Gfo/Idh/MocA family oxidoreductase [Bacteroidales bacterium]